MKRATRLKRFMAVMISCIIFVTITIPIVPIEAITTKVLSVYIDGKLVTLSPAPFIQNSRTLVPLRGVFEKLGATVDWNKLTRQAIIKTKDTEVILEVGNKSVLVNGEVNVLDAPTVIQSERTFVPFRFVAEALGHDVQWDEKNYRVNITTKVGTVMDTSVLPKVGSQETLIQLLHYSDVLNNYLYNNGFGLIPNIQIDTVLAPEKSESVTTSTDGVTSDSGAKGEDSSSTDASSSNDQDYSSTNNQTDGVDEGDIIKTDGKHIFNLNQNRVHILDNNPIQPKLLYTLEIPDTRGNVTDIYVSGDRLTLIGSSYSTYGYTPDMMAPFSMKMMPIYSTPSTFVVTYSIADVTQPKLLQDYDFEGGYVSSRVVNDNLYMITNKGFYDWVNQPVAPKYVNNTLKKVTYLDYNTMYYFPDRITPNFMLTIGLNLSTSQLDVKSYLGSAESVYVSQDNIYLTLTNYVYGNQEQAELFIPSYDKKTSIYKFSYKEGKIDFVAEGSADGSIVNQFSLDEYQNNLRIATTTGETWDETNPSTNHVFVLNEKLEQIGELNGLAPGERIYSTRFSGNRIYMVTFRQVDPFFVIDASEPTNPKVLGYLKIPGFSTYMHILDENHVLGFGNETVEQDGRVTIGGLKLSLFDVTNPAEPVEKMKEVIGVAGTNSELQYNHKALMISLSKGIMAFPITVAQTPYASDFSGAYVYRITKDSFNYMGSITHQSENTLLGEAPYQYFDYNYNVNRLVYIGDYIYSLSSGKMVVTSLTTMKQTGEVVLPLKVYDTPYYIDSVMPLK